MSKSTRSDLIFSAAVTASVYAVSGPVVAMVVAAVALLATTGVRAPLSFLVGAARSAWQSIPSVGDLRGASLPLRWSVVVFLAGVVSGRGGVPLPDVQWPSIDIPSINFPVTLPNIIDSPSPTSATYVYEKDDHAVPGHILSAFDTLNREGSIVATLLEADTKDGTGDVPDQYKAVLSAAKDAGLPVLVVASGDEVLSVFKDTKDEQSVLDAVKL